MEMGKKAPNKQQKIHEMKKKKKKRKKTTEAHGRFDKHKTFEIERHNCFLWMSDERVLLEHMRTKWKKK